MSENNMYAVSITNDLICRINVKPSYSITFNNESCVIGVLNFDGPKMIFTGEAEESAKVFFDFIAKSFSGRFESKLQWTTDLPTQEGWYWLAYEWQGVRKSEIVEVYQYPDGLSVRFGGTNNDEPIGNITPTNEWYGPIEPPEYR